MKHDCEKTTIRVLVTEPAPDKLSQMEKSLRAIPEIGTVVGCLSAEEALAKLGDEPYELLITSLNLPGIDGLGLIKRVIEEFSATKCIACTNQEDIGTIQSVFGAGAHGYLVKDCELRTVRESIQQVLNGEYCVSPKIAHQLVSKMLKKDMLQDLNPLSNREKEILTCLAEGYRYKEIAHQKNLSYNTVHAHVKNIYKKLNKKGRRSAIRHAKEFGLIDKQGTERAKVLPPG